MEFHLEPGDVLVNIITGNSLYNRIKRACIGNPYSHVFMYLGQLILARAIQPSPYRELPMLFESDGDGVIVESLSSRYGQEVVVLRLKSEFDRKRIPHVLEEALKLSEDTQAHYDYMCIVKHVLPRLMLEKLGLPTWVLSHLPLAWQRDARQICSEAVFEIFDRAKLVDILLPYCRPPMPGDFVTDSPLLEESWRGTLSEELV